MENGYVLRLADSSAALPMAYFVHRITNAIAEGMNSKISTMQKMAYGYRNKEHFKTAICFHCGNLQLYPGSYKGVVIDR